MYLLCPEINFQLSASVLKKKERKRKEVPWCLSSKESACQAGDMGLIPGLGRSPGEGNDKLLQYSCLGNPNDRGALWATVQGTEESDMTKQQQ